MGYDMKIFRYTIAMMLAVCLGFAVTIVSAQDVQLSDALDRPLDLSLASPVSLDAALFAMGVGLDVSVITSGVSSIEVNVPVHVPSVAQYIALLAAEHNLCAVSHNDILLVFPKRDKPCTDVLSYKLDDRGNSVSVDDNNGVGGNDADVPLVQAESLANTSVQPFTSEAKPLRYRIRVGVVQVSRSASEAIGINWSEGMFLTAAQLVFGADYLLKGYFPQPDFDKLFEFLATSGVALRRDEYTLMATDTQEVLFNRGGSINVQLVGDGTESIQKSFSYGLGIGLTLTNKGDYIELLYTFSDSSPNSVSNASLIDLTSTTLTSVEYIPCDSVAVLGDVFTERKNFSGEGLPAVSAVPVVGYLGGIGESNEQQASYIITAGIECLA